MILMTGYRFYHDEVGRFVANQRRKGGWALLGNLVSKKKAWELTSFGVFL